MPGRMKIESYPIRTDLHPDDDAWFKAHPDVAGRAVFEDRTVILNPYSRLSAQEKQAVAQNERLRLYMHDTGYQPKFAVTDEQRTAFRGTPYEGDETAMKQTILGRIFSGDPSARATDEQVDELRQLLFDDAVNAVRPQGYD